MKPDTKKTFGAEFYKQVFELLENLGKMTEIIDSNYSQIKEIL